jgi:hypothetical protein
MEKTYPDAVILNDFPVLSITGQYPESVIVVAILGTTWTEIF